MKVVRLSALGTGRFYPPGNIPGTHFCKRLSQPQGHSAAGRIMSMKNFNDTLGNRTRDFRACSAVPQPTAPPRTPQMIGTNFKSGLFERIPLYSNKLCTNPAFYCCACTTVYNTGLSKKMDGIWNRYNLKSTGRIYTFGILKCSEKFKVLDLP